jgi:allophycocyanin-B
MRVSVVKVLTDNEKKIVDESAKQLFSRKPEYVAPGRELLRATSARPMSA